jgi:hypothetical protein
VAFVLGLWHPDGDLVPYIEEHRQSWWAWHMWSGLIFVVTAGSHAALFWWLVRGRGRKLAVAGGILYSAGAASFGAALIAEASTHWYAASPVLDQSESHSLLTYISEHDGRLVVPLLIGLVLLTVAPLVISAGLWLSHTLRAWVIGVFLVGSVAGNVFGPASILSLAVFLVMCLMVWERAGQPKLASATATV